MTNTLRFLGHHPRVRRHSSRRTFPRLVIAVFTIEIHCDPSTKSLRYAQLHIASYCKGSSD